jgi:phosphoribosylformylglycinamidine synthase
MTIPTVLPDSLVAEAAGFGLKGEELTRFVKQLGRLPSREEIAVCGALWSEHCSYKSSKVHLRRFHTEEPWVWQGPGENAGIVGLTENWGIAFKMESHNHPSYIEPYQGAATGVGGILRDVFCMGAWPVANMNCLRFGEGEWNASLLKHTVRGIGDYGNSMGVPTPTGDTSFHPGYSKNILVNAFTAGVIRKDAIFRGVLTEGDAGTGVNPITSNTSQKNAHSERRGVDIPLGAKVEGTLKNTLFPENENVLVYFGQATGRDGVHGATMSSSEFSATGESLKPTVQVGDPFAERRLLEATLHLIQQGLTVGLQDMGAAGLTSSSVEMAGRSGCGVAIDLALVPQRAANMQAFELLLSESQERMLCAVAPERVQDVLAALAPFDVEAAVIGRVNATGRFVCVFDDHVCTAIEVGILVDDIPKYEWPVESRESYLAARPFLANTSTVPVYSFPPVDGASVSLGIQAAHAEAARSLQVDSLGQWMERHATTLEGLLRHPAFASRFPLTSQYCGTVQGNTIAGCGNLQDAAAGVVRLPRFAQEASETKNGRAGTASQAEVGVAMAGGCEERWVELHPFNGAILSALKVARRIVAVGGTPLGLTDCLNFGSPTHPSVMRQLSDAIDGITAVSKALAIPVVSGNVSLNNQTEGRPIPPTPMLGVVGRVDDVSKVRLTRLPSQAWQGGALVPSPPGAQSSSSRYVLAHVNLASLSARMTLECGLVWWLLAERNANVPEPDIQKEKDLWTALEHVASACALPLCAPVGHGGVLLGALRLAFENEATLTLSKEAATLPARAFVSEGQAGFLVGFQEGHETSVQKEASSRGLEMTLLGTLVRRTQTSAPSQSQDERLRTAWQSGLEPFFSAPV